ncbi:unnamed protein product [Fraxinus pennsylvanica]|uniref:Uncharacterized protein n=1 Tax=Fraxinus pennsylvanica TaxID=56036 RepID=A0AAD2DG98_9LAMI|nr:unnamed protein product [Fraxinus pennsylvanica]
MQKFMMLILIMFFLSISSVNSDPPAVPALYVFGDSLFDNGNNNLLPTLAKADFSPYGMNFDGGATGRFTNGKTIPDLIAEFLGLPFSPPYLSIRASPKLTGLNFASGSCGILPETGNFLGKCLNFAEQIDSFNNTSKQELPKHYKTSSEVSDYLSKSIFVITIGSNDYINNYLEPGLYDTSKHYDPQSFARLLVGNLSLQFQRLYKLGARKIIMFEIGPIGCIPSVTRQFNHSGQCVEDVNQLAVIFNNELATMHKDLTSPLKASEVILGQGHMLGYDAQRASHHA